MNESKEAYEAMVGELTGEDKEKWIEQKKKHIRKQYEQRFYEVQNLLQEDVDSGASINWPENMVEWYEQILNAESPWRVKAYSNYAYQTPPNIGRAIPRPKDKAEQAPMDEEMRERKAAAAAKERQRKIALVQVGIEYFYGQFDKEKYARLLPLLEVGDYQSKCSPKQETLTESLKGTGRRHPFDTPDQVPADDGKYASRFKKAYDFFIKS